ncbi:glycosyltransferase family 4 protein [Rhodococcus rhodochrous]|uniref:Glycosyltransferase involved in cell wall biosynthesis n=1 Tax=Rhodococcus rhodochrous J45 TaxID=935266 RepID=A0A562E115_RHORH|nr:glycosyltransferase family 4 protein [Rhodococcus rhodochrous]TWH15675.1 glycosyltransferase involved in cell wall biosynthesis [Rhodococcus rhodochrous J45]
MRIGVVHSFYSSNSPSGENSVVLAQVDALRRAGHDVKLFAKHTDSEQQIPFYKARSVLRAAQLTGPDPSVELEKFSPDVVHVHNLFPNWGTGWLKSWGAKTVATLHNYRTVCSSGLLWRDGHDCRDCLEKGTLSAIRHRCYRDSAIASAPLAFASRNSGAHSSVLRSANTIVVLNSEAQKIFAALTASSSVELVPNFAAKIDLSSKCDAHSWVYVGRLTHEKGVLWLLENWPEDSTLEIVGTGPLADQVESAATAQPRRFKFHGRVDSALARELICSAKGLILPSLWSEGIPTVALEALQTGTPVLISDQCSSAKELTREAAGRIFNIDPDGSSLRTALAEVTHAGQDMRRAALKLYEDSYSESAWLSKIESIYDRVAHTRSGR